MFRSGQIIIGEYACTSLSLLNYLKTEFKINKIQSLYCSSRTVINFKYFKFITILLPQTRK